MEVDRVLHSGSGVRDEHRRGERAGEGRGRLPGSGCPLLGKLLTEALTPSRSLGVKCAGHKGWGWNCFCTHLHEGPGARDRGGSNPCGPRRPVATDGELLGGGPGEGGKIAELSDGFQRWMQALLPVERSRE